MVEIIEFFLPCGSEYLNIADIPRMVKELILCCGDYSHFDKYVFDFPILESLIICSNAFPYLIFLHIIAPNLKEFVVVENPSDYISNYQNVSVNRLDTDIIGNSSTTREYSTQSIVSYNRQLASNEVLLLKKSLSSCADGQSLVEIVRTCGSNGSEESFEIHYGRDMSGMSVMFSQNTCVAGTQYVCMSPVEYTLVMRDTGLNGWSTGSHLIMKNGKVSLDFVMEGESVQTRKMFNFGTLLDQPSTAAAAAGDQIEVTLIRSCGNSSESEGFAIYAGATRDRAIYSQTYCVAGVAKLLLSRGVYSVVMTEAEGRAWEANSVVRIFDGGLLGSFAKTAAGAEASAQFDCSEEVSTSVEQSLVGDGVAQSSKEGLAGTSVQNLFDNQVSTKFRVAVKNTNFPVEVTYSFPEGEAKTMNKYVVTNGDSVSASCNSWKIFGKTNGSEEWVMIDSQDGVEWTGVNESLSFSVNNMNAYNAYKFQCSSVVNIDDDQDGNQLEMAEWNLIEA